MQRSAAFRALMKTAYVQRLVKANRRRMTVIPSWRYFLDELFAVHGERNYRLRGTGLAVTIRPGTRDTDILQEIFLGSGVYALPAAVADRIRQATSIHALDLGGNIGLFGLYLIARYPSAHVISYEPDPTNLQLLETNISTNQLENQWQIREACVSNHHGNVHFRSGLFADSNVVDDGPGVDVPCEDIFSLSDYFNIIKMDIEGSEWDILFDERLSALPSDILVLEWHAGACPVEHPHLAAVDHLRAAGFETVDMLRDSETDGMLWAWR
jgi:FkbM family methyltransferase